MAQTSSFVPQHHQGFATNPHQQNDSSFVVVNQQPCQREVFPYRLQINWIFGFSVAKCILGSLLFIAGIANVVIIRYDTHIAIGVWCGLTILANGIIGCVLKCKQNKCLVGAFLGLSITALILSIAMLSFYALVLDYFVNLRLRYCYYGYFSYCVGVSSYIKDEGVGVTSFLLSLVICELGCSIGSVVVSCKAYSKCCKTCDANDCCTCLGCCECDTAPLNLNQGNQQMLPSYNYQNFQMSSMQPRGFQFNPNQPQVNTNVQNPPGFSAQGAQSNPCSGIVSFVINIPSYIFGGANGTQVSAVNVTLQPISASQQVTETESTRSVEQVQTAIVGGAQQSSPTSAWERVDA